MDKICFRILSVTIVLTLCSIEPSVSEARVSDIVRQIMTSAEISNANLVEIKRQSLAMLQSADKEEQNTQQVHHVFQIVSEISLVTDEECETSSYVYYDAYLTNRLIPASVVPRAGPLCA